MSNRNIEQLITSFFILIILGPMIFSFVQQFIKKESNYDQETQNFYFESFDAEYYLTKTENSTSLKIKETLVAYFPQESINHGIDRCIPRTYKGEDILVRKINGIPITVDDGPRLTQSKIINSDEYYTTYDSGSDICYRIGNADEYVSGRHKYVLEYEYRNMIISPDDSRFDELYWNTNGTSWKQRFDKLSATVTMDNDIAKGLATSPSCYVGRAGAKGTERCVTTSLDNGYRFETSNLRAGENLTFDLEFERGTFPTDNLIVLHYNYVYLEILAIVILILLIPILIFFIKYNKTKSFRAILKEPRPVQYLPPKYSVAEAARLYYYHKNLKSRDFVATLIDLVVKKILHLRRSASDPKQYYFKYDDSKMMHKPEDANLLPQEQNVLDIVNGGSHVKPGVEYSILKEKPSKHMKKIIIAHIKSFREETMSSLIKNGFVSSHEDPKKPRLSIRALGQCLVNIIILPLYIFTPVGIFVALLAIFSYFGISSAFDKIIMPNDILLGRTLVLILIPMLIVATIMLCRYLFNYTKELKVLTEEGAREINYLRGLKDYMLLAEADRLKFLQSVQGADTSPKGVLHLYERLLPYSVIFGIEESWFNELREYYAMAEMSDDAMEALDFSMLDHISYSTSSISDSAISAIAGAAAGAAISSFTDHLGSFSSGGGGGGGFSSGGGGGGGGSSGGGGGGGGGGGW
ncbi:DUF2207 domain-containing protein [Candidatus Saccharibacteria bacterium]|nr:DUF2207 domain-containing protein [Candidatus Saccharibacteria bacterium]